MTCWREQQVTSSPNSSAMAFPPIPCRRVSRGVRTLWPCPPPPPPQRPPNPKGRRPFSSSSPTTRSPHPHLPGDPWDAPSRPPPPRTWGLGGRSKRHGKTRPSPFCPPPPPPPRWPAPPKATGVRERGPKARAFARPVTS